MSTFLIDLTTARHYVGRNAVGIVRAEREIALSFFSKGESCSAFYFDPQKASFHTLSREQSFSILTSAGSQEQAEGREFDVVDAFSRSPIPSTVISCGLSWDHNFLQHLYVAKQRVPFKLVQIVYDVIPTIMPEYCVPGMDTLFPKFVIDTAWTADWVYCISRSTARDFENFVRKSAAPLPAIRLIELGCDVDTGENRGGVIGAPFVLDHFVLYVSSIEPRKNHRLLFDLWRKLFDEFGYDIPTLVFVGKQQWNSADLVTMIKQCSRLYPSRIRILETVTDSQLNWLYDSCMFTVYPSLYEGWGLPVRESFLHGKACIASANSGTAEASDGLAVSIDPLDLKSWYDGLRELVTDPSALSHLESLIKDRFKPFTWDDATSRFRSDLLEQIAMSEGRG